MSTVLKYGIFAVLLLSAISCGSHVHHRVEKGETLYAIGFYYGQDYKDIAQWNKIDKPYIIRQGQWLRVAPPVNSYGEQPQNQPTQTASKNISHIEQRPEKQREPIGAPVKPQVIVVEDIIDKAPSVENWIWPTKGKLLSSDKRNSVLSNSIKIAGRRGQSIMATAAGKVVYSGNGLVGYGNLIIVKHNKNFLSAYAHNQKMLVREGEMVRQGQKIALMGSTRDDHVLLHFEIRKNGKPVDPLGLLGRSSH